MSAFDEDEYLRIVGLKPRTTRKAQVVEDYRKISLISESE